MLKLLGILLASAVVAGAAQTTPLMNIPFKTMDGKTATLSDYAGKVLLIVNVASHCGHTPQYAQLEALQTKYAPQGFTVLGFPCNDFAGQEPGTNEEIMTFCKATYKVDFPMFDKLHVKGPDQAPLYAALTGPGAKFPGDVKWNFGKFLIGKNGEVLARFEPGVIPDDKTVVTAIEAALK